LKLLKIEIERRLGFSLEKSKIDLEREIHDIDIVPRIIKKATFYAKEKGLLTYS
jgi:hypothetical protein